MTNEAKMGAGVDILIVEDSPTQAEQLLFLLELQHHRVRVATNGRLALEALHERKPALVITDIVMPEMDGYTLCAAIKADPGLKDVPVVMVTSLSGIQDIAKSLECGADNFIRKPYEPKALLRRIEYILLNRELRESSRLKVGMEIYMGGKKHFIASGREQIVDLLISTYEEAVNMNEELQARQLEIALSNQTLRVLYRIADDLNRARSETEVCEQALKGLLELPSFRAGWFFLADGPSELRLAAAHRLASVGLTPEALGADCHCRRRARAGDMQHGSAVASCEAWVGIDGAPQNHASVPLMAGTQCLGVMNIVGEAGGLFGSDDVRMLEAVGSQVAIALQRTQLNQHLELLVEQRTAALQAEIAERRRAEEKVAKLNRVYAVLSGINTTIVRVDDRDDLFKETCRIAVELGRFRMAWIGIADWRAGELTPVAWAGVGADNIGRFPMSLRENESGRFGLPGRAVLQREAMIVQDIARDGRVVLRQEALDNGLFSCAMLPLVVGGQAAGVLALYAGEREFFDENEMRLLRELASDISFALDHLEKSHQLNYVAYYDTLTGLPNRSLISDRLHQQLQAARRRADPPVPVPVALVLIDINRFKSINDTFGRHVGDLLLKRVAERLGEALGSTDRLARVGGDHFAAVLADGVGAAEVARLIEDRLFAALGRPFEVDGQELHLSMRAGIALFPNDGDDVETLFGNAETALRDADKAEGRYLFYTPAMNAAVSGKLTIENKLHRALQRGEFVLHYQPKVSLKDGRIIGLEALLRWNDPEVGLVSPSGFIPILEETGMIFDVGRWALGQAIADWQGWRAAGLAPPRVAVNVSAVQMRRKDFLKMLEESLGDCGKDAACLDLELTESLIMEDLESNVRKLGAIRELGVHIAVDDFGTGYSSLSYLKRFPIDYLKIDQSFVRDITTDGDAAAICIAVIDLAHNLKLRVIAEGVETAGQMNYLRNNRCDELQGYLFSRPLPAPQLATLLAEGRSLPL